MIDSLLRLGPDLDEVLEDLDGLRDVGRALLRGDGVGGRGGGGVGGEVEHEDGGEADGEVLRVHLVARVLRRHPRQVVHHVHQAVLRETSDRRMKRRANPHLDLSFCRVVG